jgi:hypothetical protein
MKRGGMEHKHPYGPYIIPHDPESIRGSVFLRYLSAASSTYAVFLVKPRGSLVQVAVARLAVHMV